MRSHDSEAGATRAPGHSEKGRLHWRKKQGGPAEQPEGERAGVLWSRNARTTGGSGEAEKPVSARNTRADPPQGMMGFKAGMRGTRVSRRLRPLTGTTGWAGPVETGPMSLELRWEAEVGAEIGGLTG